MNRIYTPCLIMLFFVLLPRQVLAAEINVVPGIGSQNAPFKASVSINGKGSNLNAAQANVSVSSNLAVSDITLGDCNFSFLTTPSSDNLSFSGAILGGSTTNCTVYSMTVKPLVSGNATIRIINGSIKSYDGGRELLTSIHDGNYNLSVSNPLPTNTPSVQGASAQNSLSTYALQIKITDSDNQPINGANIILSTPTSGQVDKKGLTNAKGIAEFSNVLAGVHEITATNKGKIIAKTILTANGKNPVLVLGMQEQKPSTILPFWMYLLLIPLVLFIVYLIWQRFHKASPPTPWRPSPPQSI